MQSETIFAQSAISALFDLLFGSNFGGHATVLIASLSGALWPLSSRPAGGTWTEGFFFVLRLMLTAFFLTSFVAGLLEGTAGWKIGAGSAPVAFLIAAMGDAWVGIFKRFAERVSKLMGGSSTKEGDQT